MLPPAATPALAQDDGELAKIQHFEGGALRLSLGAASLALLGPGIAAHQASVAPIHPGPGRQLHNPALLGMLRRPLLSADVAPRLDLDLGSLVDLDARLREETDALLADHLSEDGLLVASRGEAAVYHPGGLGAAGLVLPGPLATLALGIDAPFALDLELFATGIQAWSTIEKTVEDHTETIALRADLDLAARLALRARRYSLALGRELTPVLWCGAGLDWLELSARVDGLADTEGMMATGGREFAFGDPGDPWENSLDQSLVGDFAGHGWTLRLGLGWRPLRALAIGLVYQRGPAVALTGEAALSLRRLVAYADGGIDPSALSLSQPTQTEVVSSPVAETLTVELPGSLSLGVAARLGPLTASLDGSVFQGDFRVAYLDAEARLRPAGLAKLGLAAGPCSLSLGALFARPQLRFDGETEHFGLLPLPMIALGGGTSLGRHLRLDAALAAAPLPSLRVSTTLRF
jgi:hypothetical protein